MSRRAKGDGSVYRDGSGWAASVSFIDPATGRPKRRRRRARTKAEAVQHLRSMLRELQDYGQLPDASRAPWRPRSTTTSLLELDGRWSSAPVSTTSGRRT